MLARSLLVIVLLLSFSLAGYAVEGYDNDSGDRISVLNEDDDLPREGEIDYYDHKDDTYKHDTINSYLDEGEGPVDVYDSKSGVSRSFDTD